MSSQEIAADKRRYEELNKDDRFKLNSKNEFLCLHDKYAQNGVVDSSYFIQDIWGAHKVNILKPSVHYDVGSRVDGFISHLIAQKQKIVLLDIREMDNDFDTTFLNSQGGISYIQTNATLLENIKDNSIESISALCSVEHFGLGRYGDPIEPDAWEKALKAFQRVLKPNGKLYFSVPVGQTNKLCFNAQRVFKPQTIIETLDKMKIVEMGYIKGFDIVPCIFTKNGEVVYNHDKLDSIPEMRRNGHVGLFEFTKL